MNMFNLVGLSLFISFLAGDIVLIAAFITNRDILKRNKELRSEGIRLLESFTFYGLMSLLLLLF